MSRLQSHIEIDGCRIGPGCPTYIVAEISANHNQSMDRAIELIHVAKEMKADAVKIQTYTADTLTIPSSAPSFVHSDKTLWAGKTLHDLYSEAYTPWDWQPELKAEADRLGITLFSTPFDSTAVDFLVGLDMPVYKVASFELVDLPLLRCVAATGKPVIMSTGMATLAEIAEAVDALQGAGCSELALLKCTSSYPSPADQMNLATIPNLAQTFGVPAGLSDHSMTPVVPVAAVTLGACIIEKHLTLSRGDGGPDSGFSLEPDEFAEMVAAVRVAEQAIGRVSYDPTPAEMESRHFRRSLFIVEDVKAGDALTPQNVRSIRPGDGLPPKYLEQVHGRRAARDLAAGTPVDWDLLT